MRSLQHRERYRIYVGHRQAKGFQCVLENVLLRLGELWLHRSSQTT